MTQLLARYSLIAMPYLPESGTTDSTSVRVLDALRQGARTVDEVATALGLTSAGVRLQLTGLQGEGLVHLAGRRAGAIGSSKRG